MASGLGGERPSSSAKVVAVKRRRLVEVLVKCEMVGKNGRQQWHNNMEGKRPFASNLRGNIHRPTRSSQSASV